MRVVIRVLKRLTSLGLILVAVGAVVATAALAVVPQAMTIVTANEGVAAELELDAPAERSAMYASDGSFLTNLTGGNSNRELIELEDIPQPVIDAVLAIEDADFYEHDGVNLRATLRALVENVNAGGIAQGGSTITQQLVKLSLLTSAQNLDRKATEAFYALRLERQLTKDEILERYLNTVYFGASAHGVQAAAETYWGYESAGELGWSEAALLAGIIRSPGDYDPTLNPDTARERRTVVLDRLVATGHITQEEADEYDLVPLPDERQEPFARAPTDYFIQEALDQLLTKDPSILGGDQSYRYNAIYNGGLQIYTTFDPKAQNAALNAREELLPDIKEDCYNSQRQGGDPEGECIPEFTVAVSTVDSHTGAVRALIGGPDFQRERFNLATQAKRQPGSAMKTFVLAALFEAGYTPSDSVRIDRPCSFPNPGGEPNPYVVNDNYGGGYSIGSITSATTASNNCAFVRLGQVVGNDEVIDVATELGINTTSMSPELSLPLGSYDVVPMDMAGAYAAFANDGIYNEPWYIERIEDRNGQVIYEHEADGTRAVSTQTARMIAEVLEANVRYGTGTRAAIEGHSAAGKTGTTQEHADAWFVGFTDYYTTAVWLGDPTERIEIAFPQLGGQGGFGGQLPAEIWGAFMTEFHQGLAPVEFAEPEPYSGGRFLRVPGEINFCSAFEEDDEGDRPPGCGRPDDDEEDEDDEDEDEDEDDEEPPTTDPPTTDPPPTDPSTTSTTQTTQPTSTGPTVTLPPDE